MWCQTVTVSKSSIHRKMQHKYTRSTSAMVTFDIAANLIQRQSQGIK